MAGLLTCRPFFDNRVGGSLPYRVEFCRYDTSRGFCVRCEKSGKAPHASQV
jgi:hypothetical protein